MKQWIKRITGLTEIEQDIKILEEQKAKEQTELEEIKAQKKLAEEQAELAKLSLKDRATRKKEPWVAVLDTHVNKNNIRNGFFELDWNEYFIQELIQNGYGTEADPQEEIVDRWFREIVYNMFSEEGLDTHRGSGYINVVPISKGKSEVS
jgi:hypothetical protein